MNAVEYLKLWGKMTGFERITWKHIFYHFYLSYNKWNIDSDYKIYKLILNLKVFFPHRPMSLSACEQCVWKKFKQNKTLTGGMLTAYQALATQIGSISKWIHSQRGGAACSKIQLSKWNWEIVIISTRLILLKSPIVTMCLEYTVFTHWVARWWKEKDCCLPLGT